MTNKKLVSEHRTYIVYGVTVSGHGKFAIEDDISTDIDKVREFIDNIKRNKIEPMFLHDVVEDFVFGQDCDYVIVQKDY